MHASDIFAHIDHTLLKPTATTDEIFKLCCEAIEYGAASVCVPPRFVRAVKDTFGDELTVCTVIGFPLGYQTTDMKIAETLEAIENGADEIDMVISLGDVKEKRFEEVTDEIAGVKTACDGRVLKVIVETCYLTEAEKKAVCRCVSEAGADYIKTSTGFGTEGATLEDIALFRANIDFGIKMKAAGGIRTKKDIVAYLDAGCDRVGTSSAVEALKKGKA